MAQGERPPAAAHSRIGPDLQHPDVGASSRRLGHKDPAGTALRVYSPLFARLQKDTAAADAIEAAIKGM